MPDEIQDRIEEVAAAPKEMETDKLKVVNQDIGDLIDADKYLEAKRAARSRNRGLRFNQIQNPGGQ